MTKLTWTFLLSFFVIVMTASWNRRQRYRFFKMFALFNKDRKYQKYSVSRHQKCVNSLILLTALPLSLSFLSAVNDKWRKLEHIVFQSVINGFLKKSLNNALYMYSVVMSKCFIRYLKMRVSIDSIYRKKH